MYMANQFYKNNPGAINPYYSGFDPYYGGMGYPGYGYSMGGLGGLGGLGFNNYYGGYPGGGFGGLGYGSYPGTGYGGLGYGGYPGTGYGGLGYGGLYGGYNPVFGRPYGNYAGQGSLNSFGALAPNTPRSQAIRDAYNRAVDAKVSSPYDQYWLKKNPNYTLFGF